MAWLSLRRVYNRLYKHYGPQHWWPADSPFEVMLGAILTQNTAWGNVERAIGNLRANHCLSPRAIVATPEKALAQWLKPSGYFNIKARRVRNFCQWYLEVGEFPGLSVLATDELRKQLLSVSGVGPETADDMLLYAFQRPVFVIDAYTRRIFSRLQLLEHDAGYETLRSQFEQALSADVTLFNEYHALIVQHAKVACKKRPVCQACCLARHCPFSFQPAC
ncbi:MAG TPA: endonuclease [Gammaproteobacteria bacterium]|nr:endonuclease [Gammaproteobacteria bacterium]